MNPVRLLRAWRGPSLALQILALLLGGLIVAQAVTLLLTLLLPPAPPAQYNLRDIAAALGGDERTRLDRVVQAAAPDLSGPGWLSSDTSRHDLAVLLGTDDRLVRLGFYTPLPFAGTATPFARDIDPRRHVGRADGGMANDGAPAHGLPAGLVPASFLIFSQAAGGGGSAGGGFAAGIPGGGVSGGFPGGGFPTGGFPGGGMAGGTGMPGGGFGRSEGGLRQMPSRGSGDLRRGADIRTGGDMRGAIDGRPSNAARMLDRMPSDAATRGGATPRAMGGPSGERVGQAAAGGRLTGEAPSRGGESPGDSARAFGLPADAVPGLFGGRAANGGRLGLGPDVSDLLVAPSAAARRADAPSRTLPAGPPRAAAPVPAETPAAPVEIVAPPPPAAAPGVVAPPAPPIGAPRFAAPAPADRAAPAPLPIARPSRGLFGLAPAPFVEGYFVAARQLPDGRWAVVQPAADGFPNAWQRRVGLWFLIAFALVAPLGWMFARRLSGPLDRFADAAAQLGRDPSAAIVALDGPAEIGRAAHAFNLMQNRLRAFVDDRTAMVGAISHDLRTPLTRLRFRLEDVDDDAMRDGMLDEVTEMEAMISSVLAFIRDASTPGVRERLDLRTLVDDVAEDAAMIGGKVTVEAAAAATVEVDVLGMRRLLANLVENALKYGQRAHIRLDVHDEEVIAAIVDDGPGLPDEELELVFQPFYRTAAARASEAQGSGLGLAVCRSIARAHGGDVSLHHSPQGFTAKVRVPLAYGVERALAA